MSRWYVNRAWLRTLGEYRWIAETDDGDWHEFETWREAQDFADTQADTQARTVEVELPRVKPLEDMPIGNYITLSDPGPFIFFINGRGGEYICINDDEIKPLALALLAHARRSA